MDERPAAGIRSRFLRFANEEASGRSALYEALARGVAGDAAMLEFLAALPAAKRQPNLLFATVRHLFGTPSGWTDFRRAVLAEPDAIGSFMLSHSTQTNEPARCGTLLPLLARLPQPLALIEVGASAGLCLLPEHYGYDYGRATLLPHDRSAGFPVFQCTADAATQLPTAMPEVVWRAGLDLNPLDLSDAEQANWLESLVWPEQTQRLKNLRAAMEVARRIKPLVVQGSLQGPDLAALALKAPAHATLVVFHTAVLAYVSDQVEREAFARRVMPLCRYWIANESPRVFPKIADRAGSAGRLGDFLLSVNAEPVAWTEPHGTGIRWVNDVAA